MEFTISDIKNAAYKVLEGQRDDQLPKAFFGMRLLITALEAEAQTAEPAPAEKTQEEPAAQEKKAPQIFSGYGAKLKRQVLEGLQSLRANGVTIADIAKAASLTEVEVTTALNAGKLPFTAWEALEAGVRNMEGGNG